MTQTVSVTAGYGYETAQKFIEFLVERGFSVVAEAKNNAWSISGHRDATWITHTMTRDAS